MNKVAFYTQAQARTQSMLMCMLHTQETQMEEAGSQSS